MESVSNKKFLKSVFSISLPIAFQFLITSAAGLIDGIMVGRLGDAPVAAVGILSDKWVHNVVADVK